MPTITKEMVIVQILQDYPEVKAVLETYGMPCTDCMGAWVGSLQDGARMHSVNLEVLLADLNEVVEKTRDKWGKKV